MESTITRGAYGHHENVILGTAKSTLENNEAPSKIAPQVRTVSFRKSMS